jgi:Flp pilus assembly protein protease CpaA
MLIAQLSLSILWIALAVQDVRTRRIGNVGTVSAFALALGYRLGGGADGPYALALGIGIALILGIWSTGILGGGDAKLLMSVLAWTPARETWIVFLVCLAVIGGAVMLETRLKRREKRRHPAGTRHPAGIRHPLGAAISAAGLAVLWLF